MQHRTDSTDMGVSIAVEMAERASGSSAGSPWRQSAEFLNERLQPHDPILVAFNDCDTAMVVCDPTLPDNPLIYVNSAFEKLTGFKAAEVLGRNCRFMQGPLTDRNDLDSLREAIAARRRIQLELLNHRRDGTQFWNRLIVSPVFDGSGVVRWFVASQIDVSVERLHLIELQRDPVALMAEVTKREVALMQREARIEQVLQAGGVGTWIYNPRTCEIALSDGCRSIFGWSSDASMTFHNFLASVHPDDLALVEGAISMTLAGGSLYDIEYRILTPAGDQRWVHAQAALQRASDGSVLTMSGFTTDITSRRFAEEHRAVLARELTHRVKNTLATVGAVVSQTLRDATSLEEARILASGRIASLGTAHELLVRGETEDAAIGEIVERVLSPFVDRYRERFSMAGPIVRLGPEITLALSMTLYELATNAIKYGALSVPGGRVDVAWSTAGVAEERVFRFGWKEENGPPVVPPQKVGFGTRMIERVLAKHVRTGSSVVYHPTGVSFQIEARL